MNFPAEFRRATDSVRGSRDVRSRPINVSRYFSGETDHGSRDINLFAKLSGETKLVRSPRDGHFPATLSGETEGPTHVTPIFSNFEVGVTSSPTD